MENFYSIDTVNSSLEGELLIIIFLVLMNRFIFVFHLILSLHYSGIRIVVLCYPIRNKLLLWHSNFLRLKNIKIHFYRRQLKKGSSLLHPKTYSS